MTEMEHRFGSKLQRTLYAPRLVRLGGLFTRDERIVWSGRGTMLIGAVYLTGSVEEKRFLARLTVILGRGGDLEGCVARRVHRHKPVEEAIASGTSRSELCIEKIRLLG